MPLPCYPVIAPAVAAVRAVRRVVRHKAVASGTAKSHATAAKAGVGHHAVSHAGAAVPQPTLLPVAAHPVSAGAGKGGAVSLQCAKAPGALPAGPGAAKPVLGGALKSAVSGGSYPPFVGAGGFVPGGAGAVGSGLGMVPKAALLAGAIGLAGAGAGLGAARFLSETNAFNPLIGAPVQVAGMTPGSAQGLTLPGVVSPDLVYPGGPGTVPGGGIGGGVPAAPVAPVVVAPGVLVPGGGGSDGGKPGGSVPDSAGPGVSVPGSTPPTDNVPQGPQSSPLDTPVVSPSPPDNPGQQATQTPAPVAVPEPSSLLLLLGAFGLVVAWGRWRRA